MNRMSQNNGWLSVWIPTIWLVLTASSYFHDPMVLLAIGMAGVLPAILFSRYLPKGGFDKGQWIIVILALSLISMAVSAVVAYL
jgi:hypothetical protein